MPKNFDPIHPGEILKEDFLYPLGISQYRLAKDISVDPRRINEIVQGKRSVTVDTALRLSKYFGMTVQFWLNCQNSYDIEVQTEKLKKVLKKDVKVFSRN